MIVRSQRGMTLIELVVAIVVISLAAGTIVGLLAFMSRSSAEGMARVQSAAIANAYLQDILRRDFDDVDGFDGRVDSQALDAFDNPVAGFENYRVAIDVSSSGIANLSSTDARIVTVTVTDPLGELVRISGFKARYP